MNKKGFTLIELIMVIVILGILAAVAIPQYFNLQDDANEAAEKGIIGGVRAGIQTYFAKYRGWPSALDSASAGDCATTNVCFDTVLAQGGVTENWTVDASGNYVGPNGGSYAYDSSDGSFETP
ncbi:MAG TPA: type II secretion system protein [Candidatus Omnitrophota bacterium]|jgi:MSHA pilin protein MshA|nr:type II secretion system protein [Candidatus Omnitrophota bacterium]